MVFCNVESEERTEASAGRPPTPPQVRHGCPSAPRRGGGPSPSRSEIGRYFTAMIVTRNKATRNPLGQLHLEWGGVERVGGRHTRCGAAPRAGGGSGVVLQLACLGNVTNLGNCTLGFGSLAELDGALGILWHERNARGTEVGPWDETHPLSAELVCPPEDTSAFQRKYSGRAPSAAGGVPLPTQEPINNPPSG